MTDVILVAGTIVGVLALAVGPLLLPWPWRVSWILAAEAVNPLVAVTNANHDVLVEQVVLVAVDNRPEGLVIVVERDSTRGQSELVGAPVSVGQLAALEGWCCGRTPLLLIGGGGRVATLQ